VPINQGIHGDRQFKRETEIDRLGFDLNGNPAPDTAIVEGKT
jgi:hypothetical protein